MSYQKPGSITVTFQDGSEHDFTSIETCAGLDPKDVVEVSEVERDLSLTSEMPVQNKTVTGALNDKADLEDGKVPADQLPSYVDDIVEYPTRSDFPATGEAGKIYVAEDTNFTYRWSGSGYVQVNARDSVLEFASMNDFPQQGQAETIYIAKDTNRTYRYSNNEYVRLDAEADLESVEYPTVTTLTDAQIEKAKQGKFMIDFLDPEATGSPQVITVLKVAEVYYNTIVFRGQCLVTTEAEGKPLSESMMQIRVNCDPATGALTSYYTKTDVVANDSVNYIAANADTASDGTHVMLERNEHTTRAMLTETYSPSSRYNKHDLCIHNGVIYECNIDDVTGSWDDSEWDSCTIESLMKRKAGVYYASNYATNLSYNDVHELYENEYSLMVDDDGERYAIVRYETSVGLLKLDYDDNRAFDMFVYDCPDDPASYTGNYRYVAIPNMNKINEIIDGRQPVAYADLANNLKTDKGAQVTDAVAQFDPISQAISDESYAKMDNIKGRSFKYNQLVQNGNFANTSEWHGSNATFSVSSNVATFTASAKDGRIYQTDVVVPLNHKVLIFASVKLTTAGTYCSIVYNNTIKHTFSSTTNWQTAQVLLTVSNGYYGFMFNDGRESGWDAIQVRNVNVFDLTAMGITATTVEEAIAALRSYGIEPTVYNAYNVGKIIDSQPNKITSYGPNLWNETIVVNSYWKAGGGYEASNNYSRSLDLIKVVPGASCTWNVGDGSTYSSNELRIRYYNVNRTCISDEFVYIYKATPFSVPANAAYMSITSSYQVSFGNAPKIILAIGSATPTYAPFVKDEHSLTLPVMRSAGSVADDKDNVNVGSLDMGTLGWLTYGSSYPNLFRNDSLGIKGTPSSQIASVLISKLLKVVPSDVIGNSGYTDYTFAVNPDGRIYVNIPNVTNAADVPAVLSGVILNYQLATPRPQSPAISLPQNIKVWNGGTLETKYTSPNTTPCLISLTYQANIKAMVEGVSEREDINWDPSNIVSQTQLAPKADTEDIESGKIVARLAEDLTPYSDDSGVFQDNPFISQGTGTDNGTAIVTTGSFAQLREKQGNTLLVNQLINLSDTASTSWGSGAGTYSISGGVITVNVNTSESTVSKPVINLALSLKAGHTYCVIAQGSPSSGDKLFLYAGVTGMFVNLNEVTTLTNDDTFSLNYYSAPISQAETYQFRLYVIDITSWPADVIADLTAHPENFFRYYNGPLAYNAGSLETANGVKLVCTKRQLWDEVTEVGGISDVTGQNNDSDTSRIRSKNYIRVASGKPVYIKISTGNSLFPRFYDANKNFIGVGTTTANTVLSVPSNACFMRFQLNSGYGLTYNHNITISLYYTPAQGGEGYNQHYPYVEPKVYDTGTEVLKSAGSAKDTKALDGTITGNVGSVDLATLNWTFLNAYGGVWYSTEIASLVKRPANAYTKANMTCDKYEVITMSNIQENQAIGTAIYPDNGNLFVNNGSSTTKPTGILYYELATPVVSQGTSFQENIEIDDYGMMYWLDENDELVGVPQGAKFFYPVNYKGFTDDLYNRTGGDASNVALNSSVVHTTGNETVSGNKTFSYNGGSVTVEHLINNTPTQWFGTQAQYDALTSYDANTIYNILEA